MAIPKEKLREMYQSMVRIRTFEERMAKEFLAGRVAGFVHSYTGQEAIATGACANLGTDDYIVATHRGHGALIAKGGKTDRMMAELFGRKTGYCRGKGGSMHIADPDIGILGANGIVGGGICIIGGAGISAQMRGTDQVGICFLGDASTNIGAFHEGVNLAACWNLPIVYVIENNLYGEKTRISETCRLANLADRASAYGIPGVVVDGNDVIAVYETVGKAVARARKGEGPTLVECKTYRWHGHYVGDPQTYKPKDEAEEWKKKDPILRFRKRLLEMKVLTGEEADRIDQGINEEIEKAVKFAEESPYPEPEETLEYVFA